MNSLFLDLYLLLCLLYELLDLYGHGGGAVRVDEHHVGAEVLRGAAGRRRGHVAGDCCGS